MNSGLLAAIKVKMFHCQRSCSLSANSADLHTDITSHSFVSSGDRCGWWQSWWLSALQTIIVALQEPVRVGAWTLTDVLWCKENRQCMLAAQCETETDKQARENLSLFSELTPAYRKATTEKNILTLKHRFWFVLFLAFQSDLWKYD